MEMKEAIRHDPADRVLALELARLESKTKHEDGDLQVLLDPQSL